MSESQRGFTLIELVMVIVILGVLAAVAIPKFVDMSVEAENAAIDGVAGAAGSASAINYAACAARRNVSGGAGSACVKVSTCSDVSGLLQGGLPTGYSLAGNSPGTANGATGTCTISKATGSTTFARNFVAIAAGN